MKEFVTKRVLSQKGSFVEQQISHFANFTQRVKNWYHTSHLKFAHVVKLYVAYMRNLHIDKQEGQVALNRSPEFCLKLT